MKLQASILRAFILIIILTGILLGILGFYIIRINIVGNALDQASGFLKTARYLFLSNIDTLDKQKPDYMRVVQKKDFGSVRSEIARLAIKNGSAGGIRVIGQRELRQMGKGIYEKAAIPIVPTRQAKPPLKKTLDRAMALEHARLIDNGSALRYEGKLINRDFALVDKIHDLIFEKESYGGKPIGTITIFLDDIRISTNVLDGKGERAVGTQVSAKVHKKVLEQGLSWKARAFVVTDWYLGAYEPIKDINGDTIGVLYVGILEKPFADLQKYIFLVFFTILAAVVIFAAFISYMIAGSFERMNNDLKELNKSYLDLIGFVTHELKGILASTLMNAYMVRDGYVGIINFKQRKALDSVARNLDYFNSTIKNFLNLSRIEKGEMAFNKSDVAVKEQLVGPAIEEFTKPASEKEIEIVNKVPDGLKVKGDHTLLQMVMNNLVGNAVKYGAPRGKIIISASDAGEKAEIEVYNDGAPISADQKEKLFKRFSRLDSAETKKEKGTGLGLFITKEIVEKHGGKIWVEPKEKGNSFKFDIRKE